jgi:thiol-disulfide isomerase/thioredoxin
LGRLDDAVTLARKSFETYPTAEAAREAARWLADSGKEAEAIPWLADAFTIPDSRNSETDRARDRARMGEMYRAANGSEKGLGDLVLESYDRTTALLAERKLRLRASDPNSQRTHLMEFTLTGVGGDKLELAQLKGKVVVFDFWATWCGPCRVQHPLYEEVKKRFRGTSEVIFVSVNTDEDRDSVDPFVREMKWDRKIYFEDGLARLLKINSIPTTVIVDKQGEVASRMNGFDPARFADLLTERIRNLLR